jgi:predicted nucleic acid-binding protein
MRHVADRFTVILDANVLYPFMVRDVLLSLAAAGLYRPRWSPDIMREWSSRLIESRPQLEPQIAETVARMGEAFEEAMVEGYEDLIPSLDLPDKDDRHVLAAAIKTGASVIVTENSKDFPPEVLGNYGIETRTADGFAVDTFQLYVTDAVSAMRVMRARYRNPPCTADELIVALVASGLVDFANELVPHKALL